MQRGPVHVEDQVVDPGHRLPVLDGLRAISILLVMGSHMLPLGPKVLQLNWTAGAMGMSLFFVLSGFLITSTLLHNPDVHAFLVRRLTRIIPLAYAYAILALTVLVFDPSALFWTAAFLINYFPVFMVDGYNNHFWSLCVEMHFYLAIAATVFIVGKKGLWATWPVCFAITLMRVNEGAYIHIQTHLRVDEILAGACVATLYQVSWSKRRPGSVILIAAGVALWFSTASPYAGWLQYIRPYATAALLTAVLCSAKTWVGAMLSCAPLRYISATSYALYVVHPLTVHGWFTEGTVIERYLLKRPVSLLITFAAAHVSTFYWERWWIAAGKKWILQRQSRDCVNVG